MNKHITSSTTKAWIYICTVAITILIYFYLVVNYSLIGYNDIVMLPLSKIPMPYWLLAGLGFIIIPGLICLSINDIIEKKGK